MTRSGERRPRRRTAVAADESRFPIRPAPAVALVLSMLFVSVPASPTSVAPVRQEASQARQQPQAFRAEVSRVRVDVVVTDGGEFVDDLTGADFRVFEDGAPVRLGTVRLVDLEEGRVATLPTGPAGAGSGRLPVGEAGIEERAVDTTESEGETAGDLGAIVYYVDGPSLSATTKPRFVEAWRRLLDAPEISTTVPRAAYVVDGIGRLRELVPLTRDLQDRRATFTKRLIVRSGRR